MIFVDRWPITGTIISNTYELSNFPEAKVADREVLYEENEFIIKEQEVIPGEQ